MRKGPTRSEGLGTQGVMGRQREVIGSVGVWQRWSRVLSCGSGATEARGRRSTPSDAWAMESSFAASPGFSRLSFET